MSIKFTGTLLTAISNAKKFSTSNKIPYIDSMIILLMLVEINDLFIPISEKERTELIQSIRSYKWVISEEEEEDIEAGMPLTVGAEELINAAHKIQRQLKHRDLLAEHLLLVLLSVNDSPRTKLEMAGLIFEDYRKSLENQWKITLDINTGSAARKPGRKTPHSKLFLYFYDDVLKKGLAESHLREAYYYYRYNHFRLARNYCWYALQLSPDNAYAYNLCAHAWLKERAFEKALPHLEDALRLEKENDYIKLEFANCLRELGNNDKAESIYEQLVPRRSDDQYILNNAGFFYAETGQYQKAMPLLEQAFAIGDDEYKAYASGNKAYVLMQLGQLEEAHRWMAQSLLLFKGNAYAYRNLALLHLKENNQPAAKAALLQAKRFRFTAMYGPEVEELLAGME
jgi:tetratricopeptide (TPR) repeat protein